MRYFGVKQLTSRSNLQIVIPTIFFDYRVVLPIITSIDKGPIAQLVRAHA